jgi:hypothetical protein
METYNCIDQSEIYEGYPQFEDALLMLSETEDIDESYFSVDSIDRCISETSEGIEEDIKDGYSEEDLFRSRALLESLNALKTWVIGNKIDRVIWN